MRFKFCFKYQDLSFYFISELILVVLFGLIVSDTIAQGNPDNQLITNSNEWKSRLLELEATMVKVPERYMSASSVLKAGRKIEKDLATNQEKLQKDSNNEEFHDKLFIRNTNASLWYAQITSNDFQLFLRRLVTGRPISKQVIDDLKKAYFKWIKNPSVKNLEHYSKLLLDAGKSYEILTKLQVISDEDEGTIIKYRPLTNDDEKTLIGPIAEKTIPVGNYYVWLERKGKVVSDYANGFPCITSTKRIVLSSW